MLCQKTPYVRPEVMIDSTLICTAISKTDALNHYKSAVTFDLAYQLDDHVLHCPRLVMTSLACRHKFLRLPTPPLHPLL
jgi:hypothetical protein